MMNVEKIQLPATVAVTGSCILLAHWHISKFAPRCRTNSMFKSKLFILKLVIKRNPKMDLNNFLCKGFCYLQPQKFGV